MFWELQHWLAYCLHLLDVSAMYVWKGNNVMTRDSLCCKDKHSHDNHCTIYRTTMRLETDCPQQDITYNDCISNYYCYNDCLWGLCLGLHGLVYLSYMKLCISVFFYYVNLCTCRYSKINELMLIIIQYVNRKLDTYFICHCCVTFVRVLWTNLSVAVLRGKLKLECP